MQVGNEQSCSILDRYEKRIVCPGKFDPNMPRVYSYTRAGQPAFAGCLILCGKGSWMRIIAATKDDMSLNLSRRWWGFVLCGFAMVLAPIASAQDKKDEKVKPRTVELRTKDGKKLRAFYFPSDKGNLRRLCCSFTNGEVRQVHTRNWW